MGSALAMAPRSTVGDGGYEAASPGPASSLLAVPPAPHAIDDDQSSVLWVSSF